MSRKDVENAKIALKHRLYSQPTWSMIDILRSAVEKDSARVILHYDENKIPIGCAVRVHDNHMIHVFVRKKHRGKGIGTMLVNKLKTKKCWGSKDSPSNGRIFKYNGIATYY